MVEVSGEKKKIRETIASVISNLETNQTIPSVCQKLGLPTIEWEPGVSKIKMVSRILDIADDQIVIKAAKQMLNTYPGEREKPGDESKQIIQDAIWWIENEGLQQISNVVRFEIAEKLENFTFWGRSAGLEDFFTSAQIYVKNYMGAIAGNDGYLYQSQYMNDLLENFLFRPTRKRSKESESPPIRVSILSFLKVIGISEWPDQHFILFIERVVHPEVQKPEDQKALVQEINPLLRKDGAELYIESMRGGSPVYRVKRNKKGVQGNPKYIIFAPIGLKPDIVITDAVNMERRYN